MRLKAPPGRLAPLLASFALLAACATAGGDDDDDIVSVADASPPGTPDASPPGTPDATPTGTPDARPSTPVELTITQSTNTTTITALNSISCNAAGLHSNNSYYRVFNLSTFGITSAYNVSKISLGIEIATAGAGGTQPATVRIHTLSGALTLANLTQVGTVATTIADTAVGVVIDIPVTAVVPAGSLMVVEVFTPDGQAAGHSLFVGSNTLGQTGPTYLSAVDCAATEPTDVATLGFPDMHMVLTVTGTHTPN